MIALSDQLKPIPPTARRYLTRNAVAITLGMNKAGRPYLSVSRAAWNELGKPREIRILLSKTQIAIEPAPVGAADARVLPKSPLQVFVPEIGEAFSIRDKERFVMPADVQNGRLIADLPGCMFTRYQYKSRHPKGGAS